MENQIVSTCLDGVLRVHDFKGDEQLNSSKIACDVDHPFLVPDPFKLAFNPKDHAKFVTG